MAGLHYNTENLTSAGGLVVQGMIVPWSGPVASIPEGWALCDGSNGTPDLRDRFIVGAGNSYSVGKTGGAATQAGHSHSHTLTASSVSLSSTYVSGSGSTFARRTHGHSGSGTTSTSSSLENRPPFYALALIMKL